MFTCEYSAIANPEYVHLSRCLSKASFVEHTRKTPLSLTTPSATFQDPLTIYLTLAQLHFQRPLSPMELSWVEFAHTQLTSEEIVNPHHTSSTQFDFCHASLTACTFLSGEAAPGTADLLLGAVLAGRMRAATNTFVLKYFRLVRWWNSVNAVFNFSPLPVDISCSSSASTTSATATTTAIKKNESKKVVKNAPATIASNAFYRAEIRVGRIISAEKHPNADRLFVEKVDIGREEPITVVSGLVGHITLEELQNRLCLFAVNLKPAVMFKVKSQGMILVSKSTEGEVEPVRVPENVQPGARLLLEGVGEEGADAQLNPKEAPWTEVIGAMECREGVVYYQKEKRVLINDLPITSAKVPNGIIS